MKMKKEKEGNILKTRDKNGDIFMKEGKYGKVLS